MAELQPALLKECGALVVKAGAPFCLFELTGPPRGKGALRYRVVLPRFGKPFASGYPDEKTTAYMEAVGWAARAAMKGRQPTTKPVSVLIHAFMQIPVSWTKREKSDALIGAIRPTGKPDFDNIAKGVCDGMTGIVWQDDAPVIDGRVIKIYSDDPALRVEVREFVPPT